MPEFTLLCRDKKNSLDLRMATRAKHLDYVQNGAVKILLAGPLLDEQEKPTGSLIIVAAAKREDVEAFAENDPYARAGLFESVDILPFRIVTGDLTQKP